MKLEQSDYMKIAIWWGKNDTFDRRSDMEGCKLRGIFLEREMNTFLAPGVSPMWG